MRTPTGKGFIAAAVVAVALLPNQLHGDVGAVRLSVAATGFKNVEGQAIVAVYVSKETWLHPDKAVRLQKVNLTGASISVGFADDIPGVGRLELLPETGHLLMEENMSTSDRRSGTKCSPAR